MTIQSLGIKAYASAMQNFNKAEQNAQNAMLPKDKLPVNDFKDVLASSLEKVNSLQTERSSMVSSFASGENQNVHELMIAMQKAGLAMNMTSAVRNKVLEAYKDLTRMQF